MVYSEMKALKHQHLRSLTGSGEVVIMRNIIARDVARGGQ